MYKVHPADIIDVIKNMFVVNQTIKTKVTRQSKHYHIPLFHKNIGERSIRYRGAVIWNNVLKSRLRLNESEISFVKQFKIHIMAGSIDDKLL